jgi:aspartyl/asparaginyl beta-hydroxylase (cupin superfamily)
MPKYKSSEPNFFNPKDYDWAKDIIVNSKEIKQDLLKILEERKGSLIPYYSKAVVSEDTEWTTLAFKTWGIEVKDNINKSETIRKLIDKYPFMVSASMNLLKAGAKLEKHQGDANAIFRCHLGISIEATLPELGFEVENERRPWEEGELLIFTDAKEHSAWNNSQTDRLIFLFDIIREPYRNSQKKICLNVRSFLLLQWIGNKIKGFLKWPKWIHRIIHFKLKVILWILYPYQLRKGVIIKHT